MPSRTPLVGGALASLIVAAALVALAEPREAASAAAPAALKQRPRTGAVPSTQRLPRVQDLAWLAGCWERSVGASVMEEQWMRPRGGAMLGMSRTVRRDTTIAYEHLRIYDRDDRTVYAALPSGQAMAEFETGSTSDSMVTFENPTHDFPQRIIYRRRGADSLLARIEGTRAGQPSAVDFAFRRMPC